MVTASYVPLASLLVACVLGADTKTAATVALVVAIAMSIGKEVAFRSTSVRSAYRGVG